MSKYIIKMDIIWDTGESESYHKDFDALNINNLKEQFKTFISEKALKVGASSFTGTADIKKQDTVDLGVKSFNGTFSMVDSLNIQIT